MKIIEFCGNPGSGKSTVCTELLKQLTELGFQAYDYNDLKQPKYYKNIKYLLQKDCRNTFRELLALRKGSGVFSKRNYIYSFKCAVVVTQLKQWEEKEAIDYILFDEGIVQYITTLYHGVNIPQEFLESKDILNSIKNFYQKDNVYLINCVIEEEENVNRLKKRSREKDRFLLEDDKDMREALQLKRNNLDSVIYAVNPRNCITIKLDNTDDACNIVKNYIGV